MEFPPNLAAGRPRYVVPATAELAKSLAAALAPEHIREVRQLSRLTPAAAVGLSLAASREAYAVLSPGGEPLFMMGVESAGLVGRTAIVWMLAAPAAKACPVRVLRSARWGVARAFMASAAAALIQFIPGWYAVGRAFAVRLGFRLLPLPGWEEVFLATLPYPDFRESYLSQPITIKPKGVTHGFRNTKHP